MKVQRRRASAASARRRPYILLRRLRSDHLVNGLVFQATLPGALLLGSQSVFVSR